MSRSLSYAKIFKKKYMSPKFKQENGYTFKIYSNEEDRMHIHVVKAEKEAKYWLEPSIELAENFGFSSKELRYIYQIVVDNGDIFKQQFAQHVGKSIND